MTFKLFTTQNCPKCPGVKKFLSLKGKQFTEVDAEPLDIARELQVKYGALTVPVLVRDDGEFVIGPNWSKITNLL